MREQLLAAAALSLAESNPIEGMQMLVQSASSGKVLSQFAGQMTGILAEQNPTLASERTLQLPEGNDQQSALADLKSVWGTKDRGALQSWIASSPSAPLHDSAAKFFNELD